MQVVSVRVILVFIAILLTCLFFRFVRYLSLRFKFIKTLTGLRCVILYNHHHLTLACSRMFGSWSFFAWNYCPEFSACVLTLILTLRCILNLLTLWKPAYDTFVLQFWP